MNQEDTLFGVRILIAEDNEMNQFVLRTILDRTGCAYEFASDGREVCQKARLGNYDLILMDCQMPNLSGLDAAVLIRRDEAERQVKRRPIIALTANAMAGDRQRCLDAGMDDFFPKPFKSKDLVERITKWVKEDCFAERVGA